MDEATRLREFLHHIRDSEGKVCEEYETCNHRACSSSYAAHALSDAALSGLTLDEFMQQQAKIVLGLNGAIATHCLACGTVMVQAIPDHSDKIECPACCSKAIKVEKAKRNPDGNINNCALASGYAETDCQMCPHACPDKASMRRPYVG